MLDFSKEGNKFRRNAPKKSDEWFRSYLEEDIEGLYIKKVRGTYGAEYRVRIPLSCSICNDTNQSLGDGFLHSPLDPLLRILDPLLG